MMLQEMQYDLGEPSPPNMKPPYSRGYTTQETPYGDEIKRLSDEKRRQMEENGVMLELEEEGWRETLREQLNQEIDIRVREALDTPPLERVKRNSEKAKKRQSLNNINKHITFDLTEKEHEYLRAKQWREIRKRRMKKQFSEPVLRTSKTDIEAELRKMENTESIFPGVCGLTTVSTGLKTVQKLKNFACLSQKQKLNYYYYFTKEGLQAAMKNGRFSDGSPLTALPGGKYVDQYGVVRNEDGPFWPDDYGPMFAAPQHKVLIPPRHELLWTQLPTPKKSYDNQTTSFLGNWRGVQIAYDSERSSKDYSPIPVSEGLCPSLTFESRFESGNLRQARRVGHYEYELVLKTDLYTKRHTQWFYFRIQNMVAGVIYKFRIVNLLKKDSLYNHGMRPLFYSEKQAEVNQLGWIRTGFNISYSRNDKHLQCPLLPRDIWYYQLEWQMDFAHSDDTCYMAHCYPYTFTDLRDYIETIVNDPNKQQVIQRDVLCESRAGNTCFLLTVTNFAKSEDREKKAIIATARVHPGESNSSWMMKGLIDFLTSNSHVAQELRKRFVFKIVPMLNPDGVIVGNYRCSLGARDLNRNYRHPRKESFPTVWHTKAMMDELQHRYQIVLYCDLHGHSRKSNVFMYGCNSGNPNSVREFVNERLFPYLMSQRAPDKFSFNSCKFHIRRCKEATGRVVMWRQMRIMNSFTMEATFSGTNNTLSCRRHFNQRDFQDMGRVFCEAILDYDDMERNTARQSEVILSLTRTLTTQLLDENRMLPAETTSQSTVSKANQVAPSHHLTSDGSDEELHVIYPLQGGRGSGSGGGGDMPPTDTETPLQSPIDQITSTIRNFVSKGSLEQQHNKQPPGGAAATVNFNTSGLATVTSFPDVSQSGSRDQGQRSRVNELIDSMSVETIDGCMNLLDQLKVTEMAHESLSSDSDSESDPEMKSQHHDINHQHRKKKKKKKKHKDKDKEKHGNQSKSQDVNSHDADKCRPRPRPRSGSTSALPAISSAKVDTGKLRKEGTVLFHNMPAGFKSGPKFVSKYDGRRNGGIPCFSEERSLERATQRMQEMRKRMEEKQRDEQATYYVRDQQNFIKYAESNYRRLLAMTQFQREKTSDEIRKSFQQLLHEFSSPKLGYTHTDDLESARSHVSNMPPYDLSAFNELFEDLADSSEKEGSDESPSHLESDVASHPSHHALGHNAMVKPHILENLGIDHHKPPPHPLRNNTDTAGHHSRFTGAVLNKSKAKYMKSGGPCPTHGAHGPGEARKAISADSQLYSTSEDTSNEFMLPAAPIEGFTYPPPVGHHGHGLHHHSRPEILPVAKTSRRPKRSPNLLSKDFTQTLLDGLKSNHPTQSHVNVQKASCGLSSPGPGPGPGPRPTPGPTHPTLQGLVPSSHGVLWNDDHRHSTCE